MPSFHDDSTQNFPETATTYVGKCIFLNSIFFLGLFLITWLTVTTQGLTWTVFSIHSTPEGYDIHV